MFLAGIGLEMAKRNTGRHFRLVVTVTSDETNLFLFIVFFNYTTWNDLMKHYFFSQFCYNFPTLPYQQNHRTFQTSLEGHSGRYCICIKRFSPTYNNICSNFLVLRVTSVSPYVCGRYLVSGIVTCPQRIAHTNTHTLVTLSAMNLSPPEPDQTGTFELLEQTLWGPSWLAKNDKQEQVNTVQQQQ